MVKKPRRMRTFARTASKSMEKKLVENAKELKRNPYLVIPDYKDSYSEKYFGKLKKKIDKVNRFANDLDKLEKISKKRGIEGAIAGSLLLAHSEKAPYLAVSKFPTGDVTYAQRGKADKEKLIATQHFDDPILRILGIKDIAIKKKIFVYSWNKGFFSSGKNPNPPADFIDFVINKLDLNKKDNIAICRDLKPDVIKKKANIDKNYLKIYWKSADLTIAISENSATNEKNTIFSITKYMINTDISNDFKISVVGRALKEANKEVDYETIKKDDYISGKINDYNFIKENMQKRKQDLKESPEKMFILDGVSYGTNADEFIDALDPNEYEKEGLKYILNKIDEPVVFEDATPNKVLEKYWSEYGLETIENILNQKEMAGKFYSLKDEPSDILELALNYKKRQKILSKFPRYDNLPTLPNFVHKIALTYKTFGEKKTLTEIKNRPSGTKAKSLSYAFLLALGKGSDKKWQYSEVEIEYGNFLKDHARKLLDSDPKDYHKNLKELLTASGFTEDIDSKKN